jgi:hypothetical protein
MNAERDAQRERIDECLEQAELHPQLGPFWRGLAETRIILAGNDVRRPDLHVIEGGRDAS